MEKIIALTGYENKDSLPFVVELCGITEPDPQYHISRQCSDFYCIEYVYSGEGIVTVGDTTVYPKANDIYLLPSGYPQNYYSNPQNPYRKIWVCVSGSLCKALYDSYQLEPVRLVPDLDIAYLFEEFLSVCQQNRGNIHATLARCSVIFHQILSEIYLKETKLHREDSSTAYMLRSYIDTNIYEALSIKHLEEYVHLSASQINRIFSGEYHQTPYRYILSEKINNAKKLLTNTCMPVKEISAMLNFNDEHYFSNIFKSKVGTTPTVYRKQHATSQQQDSFA